MVEEPGHAGRGHRPGDPDCAVTPDPFQGKSPFVLDISSDEESSGLLDYEPKFTGSDDYDWLAEILRDEASPASGGDSDEVVVVNEVNAKSKTKSLWAAAADDDDDCVILDCDPDKTEAATDVSNDDGSSDDLVVVREKGQIACRDYPHPRHLCVSFPFSSTSHDKHCNLCHCYVCDLPAPCISWGTGAVDTDHCHASDKVEQWRVLRKQSKGVKTGMAPAVKLPNGIFPVLPQCAPLPVGVAHIVAHPVPNNTIRTLNPCSASSTSCLSPGNISAGSVPRFQPQMVSQRLIRVNEVLTQRIRAHSNCSQLTPLSVSSMTAFKRSAPVRSHFAVNSRSAPHPWNALSGNFNPVTQKNPTSRHSVLPGARLTQQINMANLPPQYASSNLAPCINSVNICTQPPAYPFTGNATNGWPNSLSQSYQQPVAAQAPGANGGQSRISQSEAVKEPIFQSTAPRGFTVAEIENWLLDDVTRDDIEGTPSIDFENLLGECPPNGI